MKATNVDGGTWIESAFDAFPANATLNGTLIQTVTVMGNDVASLEIASVSEILTSRIETGNFGHCGRSELALRDVCLYLSPVSENEILILIETAGGSPLLGLGSILATEVSCIRGERTISRPSCDGNRLAPSHSQDTSVPVIPVKLSNAVFGGLSRHVRYESAHAATFAPA